MWLLVIVDIQICKSGLRIGSEDNDFAGEIKEVNLYRYPS